MAKVNTYRCDNCEKIEMTNGNEPNGWIKGIYFSKYRHPGGSEGCATTIEKRKVFFCTTACVANFAHSAFFRTGADKMRLEMYHT